MNYIKLRITKEHIVTEIRRRYKVQDVEISKTALGKGQIHLTCNHGDCQRIGQFVLQYFPKQVFTYFAYNGFRKGRLSIYFKR